MADDDTTRIVTRTVKIRTADETTYDDADPLAFGDEDPDTKLYRPIAPVGAKSETRVSQPKAVDFLAEPVVGWLVVIDGPGRGQSLTLGYGVNSIGRGPDARVSLDFGDEEISRRSHASLTYDTRGRKFYIQHGGGTNLTYLGDAPVLQPHEIKGREIIGLGKTRLIFIPFCGPEFEWEG